MCGSDESAFLWAITGIAVPCAVAWSMSSKWSWLKQFRSTKKLTFTILELSLLSGSLVHLPVDAIGGRAHELAGFMIGTAMLVISGRALPVRPDTLADCVISILVAGLVVYYVAFTLYRPAATDHPSIAPNDWKMIAAVGFTFSLIPLVAGIQVGKNRYCGI